MIIKWLIEERKVPGIGLLNTGDIATVPRFVGKILIRMGVAEEFIIDIQHPIEKKRGEE